MILWLTISHGNLARIRIPWVNKLCPNYRFNLVLWFLDRQNLGTFFARNLKARNLITADFKVSIWRKQGHLQRLLLMRINLLRTIMITLCQEWFTMIRPWNQTHFKEKWTTIPLCFPEQSLLEVLQIKPGLVLRDSHQL